MLDYVIFKLREDGAKFVRLRHYGVAEFVRRQPPTKKQTGIQAVPTVSGS
ncbi:hypothetical protein [Phenylobacterium sp.]|nr:hypothetical protein [Phenylobacterium sp.]